MYSLRACITGAACNQPVRRWHLSSAEAAAVSAPALVQYGLYTCVLTQSTLPATFHSVVQSPVQLTRSSTVRMLGRALQRHSSSA